MAPATVGAAHERPLAPYDGLADVYDLMTDGPDVAEWVERLDGVMRSIDPSVRSLLDVACGTGAPHRTLSQLGYEITGCDLSSRMLEQAEARGYASRLVQCDMRQVPNLGTFDVATCLNDSLNHLADIEDVQATFRAVRARLRPGGLLVFDVTTPARYAQAADAILEDGSRLVLFRGALAATENSSTTEVRVDVLERAADGRWDRRTWSHGHRCFDMDDLQRAYGAEGFVPVHVFAQAPGGRLTPFEAQAPPPAKLLYVLQLDGTTERRTHGLAPLN